MVYDSLNYSCSYNDVNTTLMSVVIWCTHNKDVFFNFFLAGSYMVFERGTEFDRMPSLWIEVWNEKYLCGVLKGLLIIRYLE